MSKQRPASDAQSMDAARGSVRVHGSAVGEKRVKTKKIQNQRFSFGGFHFLQLRIRMQSGTIAKGHTIFSGG